MAKKPTKPAQDKMQESTSLTHSVNPLEQEKFSKIADSWWDPMGSMRPLHKMNPTRLEYIRQQIIQHFYVTDKEQNIKREAIEKSFTPLQGLNLLDIGCGAGLVSEKLARMGAKVKAIDATHAMIMAAKTHQATANPPLLNLTYEMTTIETLCKDQEQAKPSHKNQGLYDVVTALEVVEHVNHPETFLKDCAFMVRPGGLFILSTLNRTLKSLALGIGMAEYILGWLPKGTHDYQKFMKPSEIQSALKDINMEVIDVCGITYHPLQDSFKLNPKDISINYMMVFQKIG